MREIKFRAWVEDFAPEQKEKESVMFYSTRANTTYMEGDRKLKCCGNSAPKGVLESFLESERDVVMQFTGLKDKNGKEIYEGDSLYDGEYEYIVEFKDGAFEATNEFPTRRSGQMNDCEIIGNIYENPNLLEK